MADDDFEVLYDPRFPNRPQHPDFWALSEIILWMDGQIAEKGDDFESMLSSIIDPQSILYMASQRAVHSMNAAVAANTTDGRAMGALNAAYLDAFMAGYYFRQRREESDGK